MTLKSTVYFISFAVPFSALPQRSYILWKTLSRSSFLQALILNIVKSSGSLGESIPRQWKGSTLVAVRGSKASQMTELFEDMMLENNLWSQKYSLGFSLSFQNIIMASRRAVMTTPLGLDTMNHDDIHGLIVLFVAPGSCRINVVKSTSMWSQCSRPSTMDNVASAQTPPYLWRRSTLITSLFAWMLIKSSLLSR